MIEPDFPCIGLYLQRIAEHALFHDHISWLGLIWELANEENQ